MEITAVNCFTIAQALELFAERGKTADHTVLGGTRLSPSGVQEARDLFALFLRLSEVPEEEYEATKYRIEKV